MVKEGNTQRADGYELKRFVTIERDAVSGETMDDMADSSSVSCFPFLLKKHTSQDKMVKCPEQHHPGNLNEPLLPKGRESFAVTGAAVSGEGGKIGRVSSAIVDQGRPSLNQDLKKVELYTAAALGRDAAAGHHERDSDGSNQATLEPVAGAVRTSVGNILSQRFRAIIHASYSRIWSHVKAVNCNQEQELRTKCTPRMQKHASSRASIQNCCHRTLSSNIGAPSSARDKNNQRLSQIRDDNQDEELIAEAARHKYRAEPVRNTDLSFLPRMMTDLENCTQGVGLLTEDVAVTTAVMKKYHRGLY